jgi:hypothetical protein
MALGKTREFTSSLGWLASLFIYDKRVRLPWGGGMVELPFPVAFPNRVFSFVVSTFIDTNNQESLNGFVINPAKFRIYSGLATAATTPACWIAIGC